MLLEKNDKILFIGDSITDVGRNRENPADLGAGYPLFVAAYLTAKYPELELKIINRGVSGDEIPHLQARWKEDCLDLFPTVVSILVGINDTWHYTEDEMFGSEKSREQYEEGYRQLLTELKEQGIKKIILLEPFVLPYPEDRNRWRIDLDPKIETVRKLAVEFNAELITLDGHLNSLGNKNGYQLYTGEDGVHPTYTGHFEIAREWIKAIEKKGNEL